MWNETETVTLSLRQAQIGTSVVTATYNDFGQRKARWARWHESDVEVVSWAVRRSKVLVVTDGQHGTHVELHAQSGVALIG